VSRKSQPRREADNYAYKLAMAALTKAYNARDWSERNEAMEARAFARLHNKLRDESGLMHYPSLRER
jgi:hypothetical protein